MLDLTQDLDTNSQTSEGTSLVEIGKLGNHTVQVEPSHALVRRSSNDGNAVKKRKLNSRHGAGDEMKPNERYSVKTRRIEANEAIDAGLLSPPGSVTGEDADADKMDIDTDQDNEDIDADNQISDLVLRRRATKTETQNGASGKETEQQPASWCTFQYRGIYGICALQSEGTAGGLQNGAESEQGAGGPPPPEVVIVERPMYDVELPPRFSGGQDW